LKSFVQEAKDQKKAEALDKKNELRQLLEQEEQSIKGKTKTQPTQKITRAQIQTEQERKNAQEKNEKLKEQQKTIHDEPLHENPNQRMAELLATEGAVEARSVEDAIATLSIDSKVERHPERRMKAAYLETRESKYEIITIETNSKKRLDEITRKPT